MKIDLFNRKPAIRPEPPPALLFPTADNPLPGRHTVGYFTGAAGRRLRYAIFRPDEGAAKGTVVLLHGRNESIEKYFETIASFLARGLWVATFDWRGQAGSERLLKDLRRGHVRRFADYEADLSLFLEQIVLPDTRLPFFLVAHSMGALVALSQAPALSTRIDRMVLAAPFVALGNQSLSHGKIGFIAGVISLFGLGAMALNRDGGPRPFANNILTADERRFQRNQGIAEAHPDLFLGPPSARWLAETFRAVRRVTRREHLTRITVPTLILAPTRDLLVPHAAVEALARNFRAATLIPIDGARHELFQEDDRYRAQAMAAVEAFIPGTVSEEIPAPVIEDKALAL
ncbi:alpha/beta hydrolase [Rhizobium sp. CC-YZS058]|uniref:alpha/beta hydrolase n=1 Tax=Rhizobium sp. CC-YZS058 TaxID=3042153 RepID=UPI002B060592|nr:alpha/beta hydrolase [Rhizobium sp. CC-YZS058]MEA3533590.1 alpha/beta hydrolase [Rhizobium sp. CC-YZS058]